MPNTFQPVPIAPLVDSKSAAPIWINWFNAVSRFLSNTPQVTMGILPPAITPNKAGDLFVDTVARKLYFAVGTMDATDWQIAN
jgi:hypothetical protein